MTVAVALLPGRGGDELEGRLERTEGEILHAVFPRAYAPGAPVRMRLALDAERTLLRAKTIGSKRRPDGAFDVRLRPIDLRRETREALARALG